MVVPCIVGPTDTETFKASAALICGPELAAYRLINAADGKGSLGEIIDVPALIDHLREQAVVVKGGNMAWQHAKSMLMNQATALQSLFARLVESGMGQSLRANTEMSLKLGLRAQNQCRASLETLAAIKNPPVVFAKQANIANGP